MGFLGWLRPKTALASEVLNSAWATILLRERPTGDQLLGEDLAAVGITVLDADAATGNVRLEFEGLEMEGFVGEEPYPRERLDLRHVGCDFDCGAGYLALSAGPLDEDPPGARPWAEHGVMRLLSRLTARLTSLGPGLVVNQAGERVHDAAGFLDLLGDLNDLALRPFGAWVNLISRDMGSTMFMAVAGLLPMKLPVVSVPLTNARDAWEAERRAEALIFACHTMVRDDRTLSEGESLVVPMGLRARLERGGAVPVRGPTVKYTARLLPSGGALLIPESELRSLEQIWMESCRCAHDSRCLLELDLYRFHLLKAVRDRLAAREVAILEPDGSFDREYRRGPEHSLHVLEALRPPKRFWIVTAGLGRLTQPGGDPLRDEDHIELVAEVASHGPRIGLVLSLLGRLLHGQAAAPESRWNRRDKVELSEPVFGLRSFVLDQLGVVRFAEIPGIALMQVFPLSEDEYSSVNDGNVDAWLAAAHRLDSLAEQRWSLALAESRSDPARHGAVSRP